ncbi:MAG: hypothetical protein P8105_05120 [Dehalococcoidia bacterium]
MNVYSKLGPRAGKDFIRALEKDGIIFDSGNVWITFKAEDLKGKGIYMSRLKRLSRGRLIVTEDRLIAMAGGYKIIDLPGRHELFNKLTIDRSDREHCTIKIDLSLFPTELTGKIILAYHVSPDLLPV